MFTKLEKDFIDTTSYVAFEAAHSSVWSERFGELLTRTGDLVDSFFRLMIDSKSLDAETSVENLRAKILTEQKKNSSWFPKIDDFRIAFEPVFHLSSVEVEADYGLTYYGKLHPFNCFDKQSPSWWEPYNKVKHEIFEQIEKKATLENAINALASLFVLNILHKESQKYLVWYTDIISGKYLPKSSLHDLLSLSYVGVPKNVGSITARTLLFVHVFRANTDPRAKIKKSPF